MDFAFHTSLHLMSLEWISHLRITALLGVVKNEEANLFKCGINSGKLGAPVGKQVAVSVGKAQGLGKTLGKSYPSRKLRGCLHCLVHLLPVSLMGIRQLL